MWARGRVWPPGSPLGRMGFVDSDFFPLQQLPLWRYFQSHSCPLLFLLLARRQGQWPPNGMFVYNRMTESAVQGCVVSFSGLLVSEGCVSL